MKGRTRKGIRLSKPDHNGEGVTEGKLKLMRDKDRVWTCKLKKRHRKDLSIEEIEAIAADSRKSYVYHKDIA